MFTSRDQSLYSFLDLYLDPNLYSLLCLCSLSEFCGNCLEISEVYSLIHRQSIMKSPNSFKEVSGSHTGPILINRAYSAT